MVDVCVKHIISCGRTIYYSRTQPGIRHGFTAAAADRLCLLGSAVLRYGLVLFFIGCGFYQFTVEEAAGVRPLMAHSPVFFRAEPLPGFGGASNLIGCIEIALGVLIALRRFNPRRSPMGVSERRSHF